MKSLFDDVSLQCSKLTTKAYSTSFSLGIQFLGKELRQHVYSIYGFVRFADEIVDTFDNYNKVHLLDKFIADTYDALENRISLNPILNAFQNTVHRFDIEIELIDTFLASMRMDLDQHDHSRKSYEQYILGSAEVVGLMCLHVFTIDKQQYQELKPYAMKLGAAFQKVNFLRDVRDDFNKLGRTYFPDVNMNNFTPEDKQKIQDEIEADFKEALIGIRKLPASSRGGVYLAYVYYVSLFKKIKNVSPDRILKERIRISNGHKFTLMINSMVQNKTGML
jgi:phytoene/squalene synthetase